MPSVPEEFDECVKTIEALFYLRDARIAQLEGDNDRLMRQVGVLAAQVSDLRGSIEWALGDESEGPQFGENIPKGSGKYWWRTELRKRAGL